MKKSGTPARVIEFKTPTGEAMVELKHAGYHQACEHAQFKVDDKNRTVECGKCGRELDAMHVLVLIAFSERRQAWIRENREVQTRKAAGKTIKAAVIALRKRSITPERFAILYEKYKDDPGEEGLHW